MYNTALTASHIDALSKRLRQVLESDGKITLKHRDGQEEELIVGLSNSCVFIYDTEPNLIRAFELEGSPNAKDMNICDAARWLYYRSFL